MQRVVGFNDTLRIELFDSVFSERERDFIQNGELSASLFRYSSGVAAVRLKNSLGYIIVLPFRGQMIWDAVFYDRSLRMRTAFSEPREVSHFRDTYGCYLMHCGALAMGCPSAEDTHPLHGELPFAHYKEATVIIGKDERGKFIGVTGTFDYCKAFAEHYVSHPVVKLYEGSSVIKVEMEIENCASYPMEFMYLMHINHRPVTNGKIVQSAPWDKEHMELRSEVPCYVETADNYLKVIKEIQDDVSAAQTFREGVLYNPEVVFYLHKLNTDEYGYTHLMQLRPDGTADYTSYKPEEFPHAARWMVRTKDMEALGLAIPGTAESDGYIAEKKKGYVRLLDGKEKFKASVLTGCLSKEKAKEFEVKIKQINR